MGLIQDSDRQAIAKQFESLDKAVKIVNFTQELECQYCRETSQLIKEIGDISEKVNSEIYNFVTDKEQTEKYNIEQIPATVMMGEDDRGIRYYGIPSGYEFATILETIRMISTGDSGLSQATKDFLKGLNQPVKLKVFVTPT
jgi:glutaredoxin-like protein